MPSASLTAPVAVLIGMLMMLVLHIVVLVVSRVSLSGDCHMGMTRC